MSIVAIFGLKASDATVVGAFVTALAAATVALYLNRRTHKGAERDRRRTLYGEAFQAALEWCEGVWRVRRRPEDGSGDRELIQHFHAMQERIAFYEGWLSIESKSMGRAYRFLLDDVQTVCRPLLQASWKRDGRHPAMPPPEGEAAPDITQAKQDFLLAARRHQSRWLIPRLWLVLVARAEAKRRKAAPAADLKTTTSTTPNDQQPQREEQT
jgi:hypothetical protein